MERKQLLRVFTLDFSASERGSFFSFFFSSRRRHTRLQGDWSSDVCSSDLPVRDHGGRVIASMSVAGPAFRLTRARIPAVARLVTKAAAALSAELGYRASKTEIGRASCRGRGEISVGAGSFKKKKKESTR